MRYKRVGFQPGAEFQAGQFVPEASAMSSWRLLGRGQILCSSEEESGMKRVKGQEHLHLEIKLDLR